MNPTPPRGMRSGEHVVGKLPIRRCRIEYHLTTRWVCGCVGAWLNDLLRTEYSLRDRVSNQTGSKRRPREFDGDDSE